MQNIFCNAVFLPSIICVYLRPVMSSPSGSIRNNAENIANTEYNTAKF